MPVILKAKKLSKTYGNEGNKEQVLKNIDLDIHEGEFLSIMGPSGCGKSTLLYLLGGLEVPTKGNVFFSSKDINKLKDKEKSSIRCQKVGFVFQFYNLVPNLTVEENILLPILMSGRKAKDVTKRLKDIIQLVGLTKQYKKYPSELSGGQQQRVSIARAVLSKPALILADEPIGNLDSKTGQDIMELFKEINRIEKVTIVQVTHSEESALFGNRLVRLKDGEIVADTKL